MLCAVPELSFSRDNLGHSIKNPRQTAHFPPIFSEIAKFSDLKMDKTRKMSRLAWVETENLSVCGF